MPPPVLAGSARSSTHADPVPNLRDTGAGDPSAIIASFEHYLKQEGTTAGRAEFIGILDNHLKDRGFCSDMEPLLRTDVHYDPQAAGRYIKTHLLNLLPE